MPDEGGASGLVFRRLVAADLPRLHEWLGRTHVAEWWGPPPSLAEVHAHHAPRLGDDGRVRGWIALLDGEPVAFVQDYDVAGGDDGWWPDESDPGARGIDQFIADEARLGRGLGTRLVRAFVDQLFADPRVTRVQADPSPANARAVRCYERAGFHRVGEVDTPDGRALLMRRDRVAASVG